MQNPSALLAPLHLSVPSLIWGHAVGQPPTRHSWLGEQWSRPRRLVARGGVGRDAGGVAQVSPGDSGLPFAEAGGGGGRWTRQLCQGRGNFPHRVDTGLNITRLWAGTWPGLSGRHSAPTSQEDAGCHPAPAEQPRPSAGARNYSATGPERSGGSGLRVPSSGSGDAAGPPRPCAEGALALSQDPEGRRSQASAGGV